MATPSKRSKTGKSTSRRKAAPKKRSNRRSGARKKKNTLRRVGVRIGVALLILVGLVAVVWYGYSVRQKHSNAPVFKKNHNTPRPYSSKEILHALVRDQTKNARQQSQKTKHHRSVSPKRESVSKKVQHKRPEIRQKSDTSIKPIHATKKRTISLAYRGKRPKLVIIMDDVHTRKQIEAITHLPFKVTPSIFPPYSLARHSNRLANGLSHYMIHLPMESGSAQFNKQTKTLKTSFSTQKIKDRIKELRSLFPHAVYINNHTGSTFTSHYEAMKNLYDTLKAEGFVFVDSFTAGTSKVKRIAHEEGDAYVRRDIFIDNKQRIGYIHHQLAKAVRIARKKGYAIAIGHPHKTTIAALKSAKPILKDVDVVYIDEIYRKP
ncbi:MAG: divergent polysaccharide deacetylase family protein [Sulfurovum sp.]|nr:MAG: divergent polysaccharide deacetylase family protein [Sulfurovum sp.]